MGWRRHVRAAVVGLGVLAPMVPDLASSQMYMYPQRGQSPQQQARDQSDCQAWASQQTGYNPMMAQAPPPTAAAPQGGVVRGGARGAAVGAVGGAIGGAPGVGAAAGAAGGAVWSVLWSMFGWMGPQRPSDAHMNYVNQCLADRGYQVVGWK